MGRDRTARGRRDAGARRAHRPGWRADLARAAVLGLLAGVLLTAASSAKASWTRPLRLAGPFSLDVLPSQIAFAPDGRAGVAFGVQDEDNPAISKSYVVTRPASGRFSKARRVPAKQVLALAFAGPTLDLLTANSRAGRTCCTSAGVIGLSRKGFGRARRLVPGLTGPAIGALIPLPRSNVLAAFATAEGVWVSQKRTKRPFGRARLLSASGSFPQTLAAASAPRGRTHVAWTAAIGQPALAPAGTIYVATGSPGRAPSGTRVAYSAPAGHQIDQLAIAGTTAAWIESWSDADGVYHSEAVAATLKGQPSVRRFPIAGRSASGLSLAGNGAGDQLLAWTACSAAGGCTVRAAAKDAGGRFGAPAELGPIDPSQAPAATVSNGGESLVGWVDAGHVIAAARRRRARRFDRPQTVSTTRLASDLTVAFGPRNTALATWTQGPSVMAATFRAP